MTNYFHILMDPNPCGPEGQEICPSCKLTLPDEMVAWEEFLNGSYVSEEPTEEGYYPVLVRYSAFEPALKFEMLRAVLSSYSPRILKWEPAPLEHLIEYRWSVPIPENLQKFSISQKLELSSNGKDL